MKTSKAQTSVDKWIPWYFVTFFVVFMTLDSIFVYLAISTNTGVVIDQAYEKGLAYNQILNEAEAQKKIDLRENASFKNGELIWKLENSNGNAIDGAIVKAHIIRAVQDGYDFDISLRYSGDGIYSAPVETTLKGAWTAKLEAKWDKQVYRTTLKFLLN